MAKRYEFNDLMNHLKKIQSGSVYKCSNCGEEMELHEDGSLQCKKCGHGHLNVKDAERYTIGDFLDANAEYAKFVVDDAMTFDCGKAFLLHGHGTELYLDTESCRVVIDAAGLTYDQPISPEIAAEARGWLENRFENVKSI